MHKTGIPVAEWTVEQRNLASGLLAAEAAAAGGVITLQIGTNYDKMA